MCLAFAKKAPVEKASFAVRIDVKAVRREGSKVVCSWVERTWPNPSSPFVTVQITVECPLFDEEEPLSARVPIIVHASVAVGSALLPMMIV